jgi:ABC-type oligopeptide transport system substrate-binding subunit
VKRALVGALVAVALIAASCKGYAPRSIPQSAPVNRPVRVGVWLSPDPKLSTYGGLAVRTLIYPQLFRATPGGGWAPGIVEPGTDKTGRFARTATFKLRPDAKWSDGTPITAGDLRRTLDPRFVITVDDPVRHGTIVVRFKQSLPGWRRLWSGLQTISPPRDGLFGGPYRLERVVPDYETVLRVNPAYYGTPPSIRELHLVIVPDAEVSARLMDKGELDVIAPPAGPDRQRRLTQIKHAHVLTGPLKDGGWTAAIVTNPSRLSLEQRQALLGLIDGPRFVRVLLHGEAHSLAPRVSAAAAPPQLASRPALTAPAESSAIRLLTTAMQRTGHKTGLDFDLRVDDFDHVFSTFSSSSFDLLVRLQPSTPETCWTCIDASIDPALAADADAHKNGAAVVLPLWREVPVVAVRDGLDGVSANGFSVAGALWSVERWRWTS